MSLTIVASGEGVLYSEGNETSIGLNCIILSWRVKGDFTEVANIEVLISSIENGADWVQGNYFKPCFSQLLVTVMYPRGISEELLSVRTSLDLC